MKRIFIVGPTRGCPADAVYYDICRTSKRGTFLDVYMSGQYDTLDTVVTPEEALKSARKRGAKRPTTI
jgi:hypothetical protein